MAGLGGLHGSGWVEGRTPQPYRRDPVMVMPVGNPEEPPVQEVPRWKRGLPDLPRHPAAREDQMHWETVCEW